MMRRTKVGRLFYGRSLRIFSWWSRSGNGEDRRDLARQWRQILRPSTRQSLDINAADRKLASRVARHAAVLIPGKIRSSKPGQTTTGKWFPITRLRSDRNPVQQRPPFDARDRTCHYLSSAERFIQFFQTLRELLWARTIFIFVELFALHRERVGPNTFPIFF